MVDRVEENARKAAAEAERLQQKADKEARDAKSAGQSREAFGKLVKSGQQTSQDAKVKVMKGQAESKQGEQQGAKSAKESEANARNARMARGGIQQQSKAMEQAKGFQGVLVSQQTSTQSADTGRVVARDKGKDKDKVDRDDREVDVKRKDTQKEIEAETQRIEAREHGRPNAAIDAGDRGSGGNDGRGGQDPGAGAIGAMKAAQLQAAQGPQGAAGVKQIPPELIEKLVSAVYLGVNEKGLKEFQIELKDGPLKGAMMRVSAEDGKVALRFDGLDGDTKRLLEASKGDLMRRLGSKGLTLSRLDVK